MENLVDLAAGLIIFRIIKTPSAVPHLEYLLLQMEAEHRRHNWGPPKGYANPDESALATAIRETKEETGLSANDFTVIPDFTAELNYVAWNRPKSVIYFPAKLSSPEAEITISHEHHQYKWFKCTDAVHKVFGRDMKVELQRCDNFLRQYLKNELRV